MEKLEKLKKVIGALNDKHASDIVAINMATHSPLYDFMVITTARNPRIISGILTEVKNLGKEPGFDLKFVEGHTGGEWVLADFGDIVVHVFTEEMRLRYNLEKLWGDANRVDVEAMIDELS